ncbi:MAG TPA: hypothetical protein VLS90_05860 [Thermodesulfobacteriota bacterium]|nr:hypothetical protein [Thermodesulfobacteriota bacterium]
MRFFWVLDYQHFVLGAALGIVSAILVYLTFRFYYYTKERGDELMEQKFDYPDEIHGVNHPSPPHVTFVIIGFIVWAIFYILIFGIYGGPI